LTGHGLAEVVEGRDLTKGNLDEIARSCTQRQEEDMKPVIDPELPGLSSGLKRVREAARRDPPERFTTLLHHINVELLREAYHKLNPKAAPGVDEVTWAEYGQGLEERLADLPVRVHRCGYRVQPSRRIYLLREDGRQRPIGIAAMEDKIVQQAVSWVLQQIYEEEFLGFSYGFRPGRSAHQALDAIWVGITQRKVNWVLDADIRSLFDNLRHRWVGKFLEHRIGDRRILRLITLQIYQKFLHKILIYFMGIFPRTR
jgi:retron-type reverse transcriptase